MATQHPMRTVDKLTAAISGTLAAGFFTLAVIAAVPGEEPAAPTTATSDTSP